MLKSSWLGVQNYQSSRPKAKLWAGAGLFWMLEVRICFLDLLGSRGYICWLLDSGSTLKASDPLHSFYLCPLLFNMPWLWSSCLPITRTCVTISNSSPRSMLIFPHQVPQLHWQIPFCQARQHIYKFWSWQFEYILFFWRVYSVYYWNSCLV